MTRHYLGWYAAALAAVAIAAVAGVPLSTLLLLVVLLACPFMMISMHGTHSGPRSK